MEENTWILLSPSLSVGEERLRSAREFFGILYGEERSTFPINPENTGDTGVRRDEILELTFVIR